jgi:hypothetical protein
MKIEETQGSLESLRILERETFSIGARVYIAFSSSIRERGGTPCRKFNIGERNAGSRPKFGYIMQASTLSRLAAKRVKKTKMDWFRKDCQVVVEIFTDVGLVPLQLFL